MKLKQTNKKIVVIVISIVSVILLLTLSYFAFNRLLANEKVNEAKTLSEKNQLKEFTAEELSQFNGTDPQKPIYIGLNGYVYDVTAGKEYYVVDGTYHYLAGRDSSEELNQIGGDIIKRKYPIVGILK
jgi:predicted heme/steroid binding protein